MQAGGLAAQSVNVPQGVCLPPSRLHAPVSPRDSAISRRTVMNTAGYGQLHSLERAEQVREFGQRTDCARLTLLAITLGCSH